MLSQMRLLAQSFPRVAEEGLDHESCSDADLTQRLAAAGVESAVSAGLVPLARHILTMASCLDESLASKGQWRFVSFPAFLFARSLFLGAASNGFRLLDRGFWSPSEANGRKQHELLHQTELLRISTTTGSPTAIRRVWVAWALIAVDGLFLLVRREDDNPERADSLGSFVLPGGRVAFEDMATGDANERMDFFDPSKALSPTAAQAPLVRALRRELFEELDLISTDAVGVELAGDLVAYQALEGANGAHAMTDYLLQAFRVKLTTAGKQALLKSLARYGDRFSWFTPEELTAKRNASGQTAFVDALLQLPSAKIRSLFDPQLADISMGDVLPGSEDVDIPVAEGDAFILGDTSRERTIVAPLTDEQRRILGVLGAFRRGDVMVSTPPWVTVVSKTGWIVITDEQQLRSIRAFAEDLRHLDPRWSPIAIEGNAIRLNTASSALVNFCPSAFSLTLTGEGKGKKYQYRVSVTRREIASPFGVAAEVRAETAVAKQLGEAIESLAHGKAQQVKDKWDSLKKQRQELRDVCLRLGLRQLLRMQAGTPILAVGEVRLS